MGATESIAVKLLGTYKDGISGGLDKTKGAITGAGVALAALSAIAVGTAYALFTMTADVAAAEDAIGKMSDRTGASTEFLSQMGYVAGLAGTDLNTLEAALRRVARTAEIAKSGSAAANAEFEKIGVNIYGADGNLKDIETLFMETLEGIEKLPAATAKTASAFALLGDAGTRFLPMINQGMAATLGQMQEADKLGATVTKKQADAAAAFNDSFDRVKTAIDGVKRSIADELMPELTLGMEAMAWFIADHQSLFVTVGETIAGAIKYGREFVADFDVDEKLDDAYTAALQFQAFIVWDVIPVLDSWATALNKVASAVNTTARALDWLSRAWDTTWDALQGAGAAYTGASMPATATGEEGAPASPSMAGPSSVMSMGAMAAAGAAQRGGTQEIHIHPVLQINGIASKETVREITRAIGPAIIRELNRGHLKLQGL